MRNQNYMKQESIPVEWVPPTFLIRGISVQKPRPGQKQPWTENLPEEPVTETDPRKKSGPGCHTGSDI